MKIFKVRYIGKTCYEFDHGQVLEATDNIKGKIGEQLYAIESPRGGGLYAYPRSLFEVIEEKEI